MSGILQIFHQWRFLEKKREMNTARNDIIHGDSGEGRVDALFQPCCLLFCISASLLTVTLNFSGYWWKLNSYFKGNKYFCMEYISYSTLQGGCGKCCFWVSWGDLSLSSKQIKWVHYNSALWESIALLLAAGRVRTRSAPDIGGGPEKAGSAVFSGEQLWETENCSFVSQISEVWY